MNMTSIFGPPPAGMDLAESRTSEDTAVAVTMCVLAVCTIAFRLVVRGYIQQARLEADDWLIGASGIPLIALLALSILGTLRIRSELYRKQDINIISSDQVAPTASVCMSGG